LIAGGLDTSPKPLVVNDKKAFKGSLVLGMGFTFDDQAAARGIARPISEMRYLLSQNPENERAIFPYIGGEEINTDPKQHYHRYVIDFGELSQREARDQ
jgi:hypothetical protein